MATTDRTKTLDRAGALTGVAYVVLTVVGNQLAAGDSTEAHPSGAADLAAFAATQGGVAQLGSAMEILGFISFMFYIGWLVGALRTRGRAAAWLSITAGVAGTVTIAVKIASIFPVAAGRLNHESLSPSLARVLADMNSAAFILTFLTFGAFLMAVGAACVVSRLMQRWLGWSAGVIGLAMVVLTMLAGNDPLEVNVMPFMLGLLWILVSGSVVLWRGLPTEAPHGPVRAGMPG